MRSFPAFRRFLLLVSLLPLVAACGEGTPGERLGSAAEALSPSDTNLTPQQVNGGSTGPIYRRAIDTAVALEGSLTLPDYVPIADEQPWIYFGFSTATGDSADGSHPGDMEIGFAFQSGINNGVKVKVSRWLPYIRKNVLGGKPTFYYGNDDSTKPDYARVDTGATITVRVECKPVGGVPEIHMAYQRPGDASLIEHTLTAGTTSITSLQMPGIKSGSVLGACDQIYVRRVVGIAPASAQYDGKTNFHRLGPVTYAGTQVTFGPSKSSVTTTWDTVDGPGTFTDPTHWWWTANGSVLYGSVNFPSDGRVQVAANSEGSDDVVTLFPAQPTGSWSDWGVDGGSSGSSSSGSSSSSSGGSTSSSSGGSASSSGGGGSASSSGGSTSGGSTSGGGTGGRGGGGCAISGEGGAAGAGLVMGGMALFAMRLRRPRPGRKARARRPFDRRSVT